MIKIKVTDEMREAVFALADEVCCPEHSGPIVQAVLDIVERDLAASIIGLYPLTGPVRYMIEPEGCVELAAQP